MVAKETGRCQTLPVFFSKISRRMVTNKRFQMTSSIPDEIILIIILNKIQISQRLRYDPYFLK